MAAPKKDRMDILISLKAVIKKLAPGKSAGEVRVKHR